jgi:8-oxo-dGTP diphosphatase
MTEAELTADAIATYNDNLVLVERNKEPEGLALPGGHQEPGETLEGTAIREMREETGLKFVPDQQLGVYDEPGRDPRGQKVSVVYTGQAYGEPGSPEEATEVSMTPLSDLEDISEELVFDHEDIISDYLEGNNGAGATETEPDELVFYHNDVDGNTYYEDIDLFSDNRYRSISDPENLEEGLRQKASQADGVLAATLPVDNHPRIGDEYIVGAEVEEVVKETSYNAGKLTSGGTLRETRTTYPTFEVEEVDVQDAINRLNQEDPNWIKVGAKVNLL